MARCLAAQRGVLRITVKAWRGFPFPRPSREANTSSTRPFGSATGEGTGTAPDAACLSLHRHGKVLEVGHLVGFLDLLFRGIAVIIIMIAGRRE